MEWQMFKFADRFLWQNNSLLNFCSCNFFGTIKKLPFNGLENV